MGGSSSKRALFWPKKKKSPLKKTWSQLKRVLPHKKRKKNALSLDKLSVKKSRKDKHSKKKPSLIANKKVPTLLKRLSVDNTKKETSQTGSPGRKEKDKGGLERVGEQIKKKLSKDQKKDIISQTDTVPLAEENKANDPTSDTKVPKKKLNEIIRSIRPAANR